MGKFDTFAEYLNNLLGTHFFVKYYANKSVDWELMTLQETCHGSMKVIGGSNHNLPSGGRSEVPFGNAGALPAVSLRGNFFNCQQGFFTAEVKPVF